MDSNPAKRRKTDHSGVSNGHTSTTLPFDAAAASAGLFRPSTFILETAELLEQSRVDYGQLLPGADELLRNVKTAVESVETHGPVLIHKASTAFEKKNAIKIPYPTPRPAADSQLKLAMAAPAHVNVVGSYVTKTMIRSQRAFAVDLIVEMPKTLFQDKDYLNLRYFYKRAYYLAHLCKALTASDALAGAFSDVSFAYHGDNPLLPILVATPAVSSGSKKKNSLGCQIRIIPCCAGDQFPRAKLLGNKNALRPDTPAGSADVSADLPPTPFYNATLKAESAYLAYLKLLHQAHKSCSAFVDACLLGRVWLQQRGLGSSLSRGGFGAFEWAALVALLMQTGSKKRSSTSVVKTKTASAILSPSLSATQIFKAVVQFLASTDFRSKPCVLAGAAPEAGLDAIKEGTPVLFDAGRQLNIAYKMSAWSAGLLRQHAKRTHELLKDDAVTDQFTPTFIARADIALEAYDMVLRIRAPSAAENPKGMDSNNSNNSNNSKQSRHGAVWDFGDKVFQTLKRALGDRARLVHVQLPPSASWGVDAASLEEAEVAGTTTPAHIVVGINFDPVNMARHIDHGPPAEETKEARKFREFWGDRAELRRFKDGSIQETLVWTAGQSASAMCEEIARCILRHRLGLTGGAIDVVAGSSNEESGGFEALVPIVPVVDAASFTLAREAFVTLEADIRALEDIPLHVRQVSPVDAALRSASIRPPPVQSDKVALHPMEVVLFFEASGKWPDSLAAIQRAKLAFLLRIGESLQAYKAEQAGGGSTLVQTYVGLENTEIASGTANLAYLDIVYRDTAAFRLRIHSDLEEAILVRQTRDKTTTLEQHARTTAAQLLAMQRRLCNVLPLHNQTMATFVTRFPALSPTIRLVKRWFSAHKLLTTHVTDEAVELMVLHVFLRPYPWQTPATAGTGLLRTLQFLARWDWRTEPLMVDTSALTNALPVEGDDQNNTDDPVTTDPRTRLEAWRKIDPNMNHTVLFVAATHATSGTTFTTASSVAPDSTGLVRPKPSKVVAARMTTLARAACRIVKEHDVTASATLDGVGRVSPDLLFQPSLGDFDVLIHLNGRMIKRLLKGEVSENADADASSKLRRSVYKNLDSRTGRELHTLPAHPVQLLLDQLNAVYTSGSGNGVGPLVFFYGAPDDDGNGNGNGDHIVAALWNPQVHARTFRVNVPCSMRPVGGKKSKGGDDEDDKDDGQMIEVNREAILAEIARIGGSLITQIEIVNKA